MLVAVVVLFAICWAPMLIDNVLTAYGVFPRIKHGAHKHFNTAFQLMAYFNRYVLEFDWEIKLTGVVNLKPTSSQVLRAIFPSRSRVDVDCLVGIVRKLALSVEKPHC